MRKRSRFRFSLALLVCASFSIVLGSIGWTELDALVFNKYNTSPKPHKRKYFFANVTSHAARPTFETLLHQQQTELHQHQIHFDCCLWSQNRCARMHAQNSFTLCANYPTLHIAPDGQTKRLCWWCFVKVFDTEDSERFRWTKQREDGRGWARSETRRWIAYRCHSMVFVTIFALQRASPFSNAMCRTVKPRTTGVRLRSFQWTEMRPTHRVSKLAYRSYTQTHRHSNNISTNDAKLLSVFSETERERASTNVATGGMTAHYYNIVHTQVHNYP